MRNIVESKSSEVIKKLNSESETLIEKLTDTIKKESEDLLKQLENKEKYKSLYNNAIDDLNNIQNDMSIYLKK